jgi:hypothetical protein
LAAVLLDHGFLLDDLLQVGEFCLLACVERLSVRLQLGAGAILPIVRTMRVFFQCCRVAGSLLRDGVVLVASLFKSFNTVLKLDLGRTLFSVHKSAHDQCPLYIIALFVVEERVLRFIEH